jgi:hypothetical protein
LTFVDTLELSCHVDGVARSSNVKQSLVMP